MGCHVRNRPEGSTLNRVAGKDVPEDIIFGCFSSREEMGFVQRL